MRAPIPTMLIAAACLSACATIDTESRIAAIDAALARVEARYAAARSVALLFAPWLPPEQAARLTMLARAADIAIAAARAATDAAARRDALHRAAQATDRYSAAAGA